jgi:hypothetical protein
MIDLDAKIRSLVERNIPRKDIVSELDAIASDAESRAKRFERAKKKGAGGEREGTQRPSRADTFLFTSWRASTRGN